MANMPFRQSYNFEGNCQSRREQNLSGVGGKETRELLLNRVHEERQKRLEQRLKLRSTVVIQAYIRSYLERKQQKQQMRHQFDEFESTADIRELLQRLLFFYNRNEDGHRLIRILERLLNDSAKILVQIDIDNGLNWLIRRTLLLCLKGLLQCHISEISLLSIDVFTKDMNSRAKLDIWAYLVTKGYFQQFRTLLDRDTDSEQKFLNLIFRPFESLPLLPEQHNQLILLEFCNHFLCPRITPKIKNVLIPHLQKCPSFPYNDLVHFLNRNHNFIEKNSLFYCVLALEPSDYEQTKENLQVLSWLSIDIHKMFSKTHEIEDSDDEEMDVSTEQVSLFDYIRLLNDLRVKKIITFIEQQNDVETLMSIIQLCHNLLLVCKDSNRKFMLIFALALRGTFLSKLWQFIHAQELPLTSSSLGQWRNIHTCIAVFCDMFTFYTSTVTDTESSDTSGTFTMKELSSMSEIFRIMSLSLIEMAFPMCRSSAISATPEILHLYSSCLSSLKTLHMLNLRKDFCQPGFWTSKKIHISPDLARKGYLTKNLKPFYGIVSDDDEHLPPLSTIEQRSLAILQHLPFLVEFNSRVLLLRDLCRFSMSTDIRERSEFFFGENSIIIRRTYLYEDAFEKLSRENETDFKRRLRIQFINTMGLEEVGIDGGGIFKEFVNEVLKTSFDPNRGFFLLTNDNMLYPNPNVGAIVENFTEHYYFIGRLVGKAIFDNVLVDLPLAEFFLIKLLVGRADAYYLKSLDPVLYRNLLYLRDYKADVQDLGLDFTTVTNNLGQTKVVDLKPDGRNIPVTNYNRLEYIHRLANLKLNLQIKQQCFAFHEGLNSVVPITWLKLFNHLELQVIIGGDMQEVDMEDMKTYTTYGGEFNSTHPTILLFWKIVGQFSDVQKKQLLKFVTSCSRPPLLGFKELTPQFCIQSSGTEDRMPTASTCLNLLKVPIIKEESVLRNKLLSAIEQQAGFELS